MKNHKLFVNFISDESRKFQDNTVIQIDKKYIHKSGYSSSKAISPELVENHLSHEKDDKEILAEALSEIDSPSPISIKEGQLQHLNGSLYYYL